MAKPQTQKTSYFIVMAVVGLLAAFIGFAKTFILPSSAGTFSAPPVVYIHGTFAFCWVLLFFVQTLLIRSFNYRLHMTLGFVGLFIALGAAATMLPVGMYSVHKELAQGLGDTALSGIVGTTTSAILFLSIVTAGAVYRKNGASHKRLMLLATLVVLWPAWFRFRHYFPSVSRPDIWFAVVLADSWIVISIVWDKWRNGRVHPVFKYVGSFIILDHITETICFDNSTWRVIAKGIYQLLS